jgi:hypothetical protein
LFSSLDSLLLVLDSKPNLKLKINYMTLSDVTLLAKKILVGIAVTLVPFVIIVGGLWLTQKLLTDNPKPKQVIVKTTKIN